MSKLVSRKQTSFWMDSGLLEELKAVGKRTHRSIRQIVELILQQTLPLAESGFLDSWAGQELQASIEQVAPYASMDLGLGKDAKKSRQTSNRPVALRLDPELLQKIQTLANLSQRSDRALVELCLRFGIHLIEQLPAVEGFLAELSAAWLRCSAIQKGSPEYKDSARAAERLRQASDKLRSALFTAKTFRISSAEQLADVMQTDQNADDSGLIISPLMDALDDWRRERKWVKAFPKRIVIESRSAGVWNVKLSEESSPLAASKKSSKSKS